MSNSDNIEKLYQIYTTLTDANDKISQHQQEYLDSIAAVKGTSKEKRLASQIITRFFKHFPDLASQAIEAQLDLCEDDDVSIRKQAIKDLPVLCKDSAENLAKIADVLAQLLQSDDSSELGTVNAALMTLFKINCEGTLCGLFYQIQNGEEVVRDRAIRFLNVKLKTLPDNILTKQAEEVFMTEVKKVLQDVTADEFSMFMSMISNLKIMKSISGHEKLVEIIKDQIDLDKEFEHTDSESIDRIMHCIRQALPYFSSQVESTKFVTYFCDKVLPVISEVPTAEDALDLQLELLKLLAELSTFTGLLESPDHKSNQVFVKLLDYMPLPPSDENAENSTPTDQPKLEFSYVECLMYTFHQLGKRHPEFLTSEANPERLKDFKLRLQYFARGSQEYVKKLRDALHGKATEDLKSEENKIKVMALKMTSNINTLIRDLFHNPPSYKSQVNLSWRHITIGANMLPTSNTTQPKAEKRPARTPITFNDGSPPQKKMMGSKQDRILYAPPSGKYSNKVKHFTLPSRGMPSNRRGRGFGYVRGRGRGGRFY